MGEALVGGGYCLAAQNTQTVDAMLAQNYAPRKMLKEFFLSRSMSKMTSKVESRSSTTTVKWLAADDDVRIKQCTRVTMESFITAMGIESWLLHSAQNLKLYTSQVAAPSSTFRFSSDCKSGPWNRWWRPCTFGFLQIVTCNELDHWRISSPAKINHMLCGSFK